MHGDARHGEWSRDLISRNCDALETRAFEQAAELTGALSFRCPGGEMLCVRRSLCRVHHLVSRVALRPRVSTGTLGGRRWRNWREMYC